MIAPALRAADPMSREQSFQPSSATAGGSDDRIAEITFAGTRPVECFPACDRLVEDRAKRETAVRMDCDSGIGLLHTTANKSARTLVKGTPRGCRRACRSGRATAGTG